MKQIIKKILRAIPYVVYCVFSPKLFTFLSIRGNQFYSMWKANEFKEVGSVYIYYPLCLLGGECIKLGNKLGLTRDCA